MEMAYTELNAKLCAFLDKTPNSFFAVKNIKVELAAAGFTELQENSRWQLQEGGKYYVSRNGSALLSFVIPKKAYLLAETDEAAFLSKLIKRTSMAKTDYEKNGFAYSLSKNFVCWYAAKSAFDLGPKGIRVVSLSPGLIATDMGKMEEEHGGYLIKLSCEERMGKPEELGYAIATVADERNGYLAGVDILCDGGSTRGQKEFKKKK